jgi:hypothetical protein
MSDVGLRVRDPITGAVISTVTTRLTRILGIVVLYGNYEGGQQHDIYGLDGNLPPNPGLLTGSPWWELTKHVALVDYNVTPLKKPLIAVIGDTLYYYDVRADWLLVYGVR